MKLVMVMAVAASLVDVAVSQSTIAWIDPAQSTGLGSGIPVGVEPHPSGGSVAVFTVASGAQPRVLVRRLNENGGVVWSTERSAPVNTHHTATFGPMFVTALGSTVVVAPGLAQDPRLWSFDAAGQLEWDIALDSSVGGAPFRTVALGGTSGGDVILGAIQDEFTIPIFAGSATARCFSGPTGVELWRHEAPALGTTVNRCLAAVSEDRVFLVYWGASGVEARALDSAGNLLYATTNLRPATLDPVGSFIEPGPSGTLAFGHWTAYVSQNSNVVVLDAGGAVSWTRLVPSVWGISDAVWTRNGDLVLLEGGALGKKLTRLDSSGAPVWEHVGSNGTRNYTSLLAGPSNDVVVTATEHSSTYPYSQAKLEFVGPGSATTGEQLFSAASGIYDTPRPAAHDERGNLLVALARYEGFVPSFGAVAAVVPGGDPSTVTCSQSTPNSTGQTARLGAAGSALVMENRLTLVADRLPEGAWTLFLNGRTSALVPQPNGSQGDLCLGGTLGRYTLPGQVQAASQLGMTSLQTDLPMTPSGGATIAVLAGETWYFQAWHRDIAAGASTSNFTNAVSVTFQ